MGPKPVVASYWSERAHFTWFRIDSSSSTMRGFGFSTAYLLSCGS